MTRKKLCILLLAVMSMVGMTGILPAHADFYKGKTITVLLPYPGGSGLDIALRELLPYWQKNIPGNPDMIVKNMPGGGATKALNFLYEKAKPDGLTIAYGTWHALGILTDQKGIRWVPEKMEFIGTGAPYFGTFIRTDIKPGIKKSADIMKGKGILMGGRRSTADTDLFGLVSFKLLGIDHRFIGGYKGMAKLYPALLRGEIQAINGTTNAYYMTLKDGIVKDGKGMALWYHQPFDINGNVATDAVGFYEDVPSFLSVYEEVHGSKPSGVAWEAYKLISMITSSSMTAFAPAGTPQEAVTDLRNSFQAAVNDTTYTKEFEKKYGPKRRWLSTEHGLKIINSYKDNDPEVIKWLKDIIETGK